MKGLVALLSYALAPYGRSRGVVGAVVGPAVLASLFRRLGEIDVVNRVVDCVLMGMFAVYVRLLF